MFFLHIHEIYNPSSISYNEMSDKRNLSHLQTALQRSGKSIIVEDFNLHYSFWIESFYLRQHLLIDDLLNITENASATLTLLRDIITRNYQRAKIIINLIFATNEIIERLIYCEVNEKIENELNHLFIKTVLNLKTQEEFKRSSQCNWKTIDWEKFRNVLREHISKSLSEEESMSR